jgi:hypothetical protein
MRNAVLDADAKILEIRKIKHNITTYKQPSDGQKMKQLLYYRTFYKRPFSMEGNKNLKGR